MRIGIMSIVFSTWSEVVVVCVTVCWIDHSLKWRERFKTCKDSFIGQKVTVYLVCLLFWFVVCLNDFRGFPYLSMDFAIFQILFWNDSRHTSSTNNSHDFVIRMVSLYFHPQRMVGTELHSFCKLFRVLSLPIGTSNDISLKKPK